MRSLRHKWLILKTVCSYASHCLMQPTFKPQPPTSCRLMRDIFKSHHRRLLAVLYGPILSPRIAGFPLWQNIWCCVTFTLLRVSTLHRTYSEFKRGCISPYFFCVPFASPNFSLQVLYGYCCCGL
jgi:hypothetical protein